MCGEEEEWESVCEGEEENVKKRGKEVTIEREVKGKERIP